MACNCLDRFVQDLKKRYGENCYLVEEVSISKKGMFSIAEMTESKDENGKKIQSIHFVEPNYCPICGTRYSDNDDVDGYDTRDFFVNVAYLNIGNIYTYTRRDGLCSVSLIKWGSKAVITSIMIPGYMPDEQRKLIEEKTLRCIEETLVEHYYVKTIFVLNIPSMYKCDLGKYGYVSTDETSLTRGVMWLKKEIANGRKELYVKYFK